VRLFERAWRVQVDDLDLSALACKFKVSRGLGLGAGTCELEIRNPTEEHRRQITGARRYRTFVEVMAGYREGMALVFRGDLRRAIPVREGTDWVVKVTAGDGEHALRNTRLNRSFAAGTTVETVVRHVAEAMGVGVGNALTALRGATLGTQDGTFPEGTVLYGPAAAELTRLCAATGHTWSIQDGVLQVLRRGGALEREAILLRADTGLVGAPEVVNRRTLNVSALLIPGLVPGQQVVIESAVATGAWRISQAEYEGDTHGAPWGCKLVVHRPRPPLFAPGSTTGTT
jgi:hypothetical protein